MIKQPIISNNLAPAGLVMLGELRPAVARRYTAGYAQHTPAGVKNIFFAWSA
jgi:hypothetical protein